MRSGTILAAFALVFAFQLPARAQTTASKVEVAGAYSYIRLNLNGPGFTEGAQTNGGTGSLAVNVTHSLGLVAEIGGYKTSTMYKVGGQDFSFVSYLFGPRYNFRKWDTLTPYLQTLVGGVKGNHELFLAGSPSAPVIRTDTNALAWTVGGGLDAKVTDHLAVRVVQAEYFLTKWDNFGVGHQNSFRIETGLVFRFGKR